MINCQVVRQILAQLNNLSIILKVTCQPLLTTWSKVEKMSINQKYRAVFSDWDKEAFRDIHHEDFMFIRETELLTLEEQVDNIDRLVREENFGEHFLKIAELIHENDFVSEARWREGAEVITSVTLIKNGKAWRQIANRVIPN